MSATGSVGSPANPNAQGPPVRTAARRATGGLDMDPRTKLKIINIPTDRRVHFADLIDYVIHIFIDCWKLSSADQSVDRTLIITESTVFLASKQGVVGRCTRVDKIDALHIKDDDSRGVALVIPTEFDLVLRFASTSDRDKVIQCLRKIYFRMKGGQNRLLVKKMKADERMDSSSFRLSKPSSFRLTIVPQRPKENLEQMLNVFEQQEEKILDEIDLLQEELEEKHINRMEELHAHYLAQNEKKEQAVKEAFENEGKLNALREEVKRQRNLIESVDGAFLPEGEPPISKDQQIAEVELFNLRLSAAVFTSASEGVRRDGDEPLPTAGYFNKDLEMDLYFPKTAAAGATSSSSSSDNLYLVVTALLDQLSETQKEIDTIKATKDHVEVLEKRLAFVDKRLEHLTHLRKTGQLDGDVGGGGGGGNRSRNNNDNNQRQNQQFMNANSVAGGGASAGPSGGGGGSSAAPDANAKAYTWLAELPEELTVETLTIDPRTGLHIVPVPDMLHEYFSDADGTVLHFFSVVRKTAKSGEIVKRVVMVSDQALYLCTPNGLVKRCVLVSDMDELLIDGSNGIGIKTKDKYDLSFQCVTAEHRDELLDCLQRIFSFASGGRRIPIREVPKHLRLEAVLQLAPPDKYVMQVIPFLSHQELVDAIKHKRSIVLHNAPTVDPEEGNKIPPGFDLISQREFMKLKEDASNRLEQELRTDPTIVQMRNKIEEMERQLSLCEEEAGQLSHSIEHHRCEDGIGFTSGTFPLAAGTGVLPTAGAGRYNPNAEGMFFITVEPVVVNTDLEVCKVVLNNDKDMFFTGHPNGFVHFWDTTDNTAPLHVRTVRDHTMRITDLDANGPDLLTAAMDGTVRRWDVNNGRCLANLQGHRGPVNSIFRCGTRLVSGGQDAIINVWNLERNESQSRLSGHRSAIRALCFEDDMMVSIEWGWVLFWDLRSSKPVRMLRDEQGGINCLDYRNGIAAAGSATGDLTVWDVARGTGDTINAHTDDVHAVQIAGKAALTAGADGAIRMFDTSVMKSLGTFAECHPYEPTSIFMEGRRFVAGMSNYVMLWSK